MFPRRIEALDDTVHEVRARQEDHEHHQGLPPRWSKTPPWIFKFVDDVTIGGKNLLEHSNRHLTTNKEQRMIHAGDLENYFDLIRRNSTDAGMLVNPHKTQLLCITNAINYEVKSFVRLEGENIESSETLKILGFHLDKKCSMNAQVAAIKRKFAARIWIIRHLKRARLNNDKLIRIYCSLIRPCIEYAQVIYHSMLTDQQATALERMQAIALKTILGWSKSYRTCLEEAALLTLSQRRHEACINYAQKNANNPHFQHWFPENPEPVYDLRKTERYQVGFARHERLKKAPIYAMRRLLNENGGHQDVDFNDFEG